MLSAMLLSVRPSQGGSVKNGRKYDIGGGTGGAGGHGPPTFSLQGPCCFRPPNCAIAI